MIKTSEGTIIDAEKIIFGWIMIKVTFLNGGATVILTRDEFDKFKKMLDDLVEESE